MEAVSQITYLFFIYLILAIFVERSAEIFTSVLNYIDLKFNFYKYWNKMAERYRTRLDQLYEFQGEDLKYREKVFNWILWEIVTEKTSNGKKHIVSASAIRLKYFRTITRIFSFVLSLSFAVFVNSKLDVDIISLFEKAAGLELLGEDNELLRVLLTAVSLSIGSEPLHALIVRFENIGKQKEVIDNK